MDIPRQWGRFAGLIKKALDRGEGSYGLRHVFDALVSGQWQLWVIDNGEVTSLGITEIVDFPQRRKCVIRYLAGNLGEILSQMPAMKAWAHQQGCDMMEGYGRKGWAPMISDWTQRYCVFQVELT